MSITTSSPVVLVTGCSKGGIGFALCEEFAARGCTVYATARKPESMDGFSHSSIHRLPMDVTKDDSVENAVKQVIEQSSRIDIVVANAGVPCHGPVLDVPIVEAQKAFDTNVFGVLRLAQAAFPHMAARKRGTFVTIGSITGVFPTPWSGIYASTKSAVHALTETLQMEANALSPNIHVMLVAPGGVRSNFPKNSTFRLPETSLFKSFLPAIMARIESSQVGNSMPTAKFAAYIVNASLAKKGAPRYISIGSNSTLFKIFTWLPRGLALWILWKKIGLGK
ncbi:short chain dehydrogenase [Ceratobasidium sp. AG-Ba]|nr:short chain dehydrogenase [Ceratobasidium sp. AG-Ba]